MMTDHAGISRLFYYLVVFALLVFLYGCDKKESFLQRSFPPAIVSKARSDFNIDLTDWRVLTSRAIPRRLRLAVYSEPGVKPKLESFCTAKLTKNLLARGLEIDPNEQAQLVVCIVEALDIRKPVRAAKVRLAAKLTTGYQAEPVLMGIADGIVPRPDLSQGVRMPEESYRRAMQFAISKLMHQLARFTVSPL